MKNKKIIYNIIFPLIYEIVAIISGFILPILFISNYGSEANGMIASITQFLAYITLLEGGIGGPIRAMLYKPLAKKNHKELTAILKSSEKFFKKIALIFIIYMITLSIIYPFLSTSNFDFFYTSSLVCIIGISTFIKYYFGISYQILLNADRKQYINSILNILTGILNIVFVVVLIKLSFSIQIVKLFSSIIFVIRPLFLNLYVKRKYKLNFNDSNAVVEINQKWDGFGHHIASFAQCNTDIIVITIFSTLKNVSIYSIYTTILNGVQTIFTTISNTFESMLGNLIAKDNKDILYKFFSTYEFLFSNLVAILFSLTITLIIPFVKVYTINITDVNYILPKLSLIFSSAIMLYCLRLPYQSLCFAAGHYKQTKYGGYIEATLNIVLSIILINFMGLTGVALGTLISMLFRYINYIIYISKNIIHRKITYSLKRFFIVFIQLLVCYIIYLKFNVSNYIVDYISWFIIALISFALFTGICLAINLILDKKGIKAAIMFFKEKKNEYKR